MLTTKRGLRVIVAIIATCALALGLAACGGSKKDDKKGGGLTTVGFVAVGPEGAWREANEKDIRGTFTKAAGFDLKYAPATNLDQKSQIDAFTSFVDEDVDVILLSATESSGWEAALKRAKEAEIPVILLDRGIEPENTELYVTRVAPDNVVLAKDVADWAVKAFPQGANYFTLEGPAGVGVVNERNKGWDSVISSHPDFKKVGAQTANWSTDEAKSVFETALKANKNNIQLVFAQNDEMGLGAIQAVQDAGLTPGKDVKIATIDGTKGALEALSKGQLSYVHECNPLFGKTALEVVNKVLKGDMVPSYIAVPSTAFDSPEAATTALPTRKY